MINTTYSITIKTTSICPMKSTMLDLIDKLAPGDTVKAKTVIGDEKEDGLYPVYIDKVTPDNMFGMIKTAVKADEGGEEEELSDAEMEHLIQDGNYEILIEARSRNMISGKLNVLKAEGSASGTSDAAISEDLRNLMEEKIAAGIVDREDMEERVRVMKENHVDEFLMTRVIRGYRKYKKPARRPNCIYVDPFLESSLKKHEEPIVSEILRAAVSRNGIIFEGEKSVGKNVCATTIAWLLGMPERLFTCSRQMTTSTLYGEKTTGATCSSTSLRR